MCRFKCLCNQLDGINEYLTATSPDQDVLDLFIDAFEPGAVCLGGCVVVVDLT